MNTSLPQVSFKKIKIKQNITVTVLSYLHSASSSWGCQRKGAHATHHKSHSWSPSSCPLPWLARPHIWTLRSHWTSPCRLLGHSGCVSSPLYSPPVWKRSFFQLVCKRKKNSNGHLFVILNVERFHKNWKLRSFWWTLNVILENAQHIERSILQHTCTILQKWIQV